MLNVGKIEEGFVLDHIKAGKSMEIYRHLQLDKLDCTVAIIKNARSNKMQKKDIIKVECDIDTLNLDILGYIDHNITVNVIQQGEIVEKKALHLPKEIKVLRGEIQQKGKALVKRRGKWEWSILKGNACYFLDCPGRLQSIRSRRM